MIFKKLNNIYENWGDLKKSFQFFVFKKYFIYMQKVINNNLKKVSVMNLIVGKEDIKKIGHTTYEEDGNTVIVCSIDTANIEEILLRSILKCFGDEYEIISSKDGYEDDDILFFTNLPFETYMSL